VTRVLLLSPSAVPGGAERALVNLARDLPNANFELSAVLLADGPLRASLEEVGCPVTVLLSGRTRHLHRTVSVLWSLATLARQVDVVVSNQSKGHVYGGLAAQFAGRPAVWWQHGIPSRNSIDTVAGKIPAAQIVCSTGGAADTQRQLTPRRQVLVIHPGTDVNSIGRRAGSGKIIRDRLGWTDAKLVGIVGRLQPWKGQAIFLHAAAQVARHHPEVRFVVVGGAVLGWEGDYPQQLQRLAEGLGIADVVHFAGHQDDVYPWFDAIDIVIHASDYEPFGLVLVEAMALGKPLVAAAAGGPLEIVDDGQSGLLIPPGNAHALASAVNRLVEDPALAEVLSSGARDQARQFSSERTAQQFASLLTGLHTTEPASELTERASPGLHSYVVGTVLTQLVRPGSRCIDLGAGTGAFALRLEQLGGEVLGADSDPSVFRAPIPFRYVDLNDDAFPEGLGPSQFDLVTAVEVIEHLEAPIAFLRGIAKLLAPGGVAVVTTPNVDSLPARAKFLFKGTLRMLDEHGDPTHITPIFWDLLIRQYLGRSGLRLVEHRVYPPRGFVVGRPAYQRSLGFVGRLMPGPMHLVGDNHVFVLACASDRSA